MKKSVLSFLLAFMVASQAFAGAYDELNEAQKAAVQKGQQVFIATQTNEGPWPKAYVYQRINSTPEEAMAVFSDFNRAKTYIPNVAKSQISKQISPTVMEVDYTLNVAPLVRENYTMRDTLSGGGDAYRIDWTLVRADSTQSTVGHVRFEKLGTGTLMAYYNFVVPKAGFAGLFKDQAMQAVKDTSNAIVKQVQTERASNQALLQQQIAALRKALGH